MHVVNLAIGYTLGIKENTCTKTVTVEGKSTEVTDIVTPAVNLDKE